jgi:hypothetical protein
MDSASLPVSAVAMALESPSRKSKIASDEGPPVLTSAAIKAVLAAAMGVTWALFKSLRTLLRLD